MSIERYEPGARLSSAVVHGNVAYLAGLTADDLSQDVRGQTEQTLENVDRVLALVGSDKSRILRVEIWLADIADFDAMNAVYDAWLDGENVPARACVESRLAGEEYLVEIMVTAVAEAIET